MRLPCTGTAGILLFRNSSRFAKNQFNGPDRILLTIGWWHPAAKFWRHEQPLEIQFAPLELNQ
jgi:hypothetical protein